MPKGCNGDQERIGTSSTYPSPERTYILRPSDLARLQRSGLERCPTCGIHFGVGDLVVSRASRHRTVRHSACHDKLYFCVRTRQKR